MKVYLKKSCKIECKYIREQKNSSFFSQPACGSPPSQYEWLLQQTLFERGNRAQLENALHMSHKTHLFSSLLTRYLTTAAGIFEDNGSLSLCVRAASTLVDIKYFWMLFSVHFTPDFYGPFKWVQSCCPLYSHKIYSAYTNTAVTCTQQTKKKRRSKRWPMLKSW